MTTPINPTLAAVPAPADAAPQYVPESEVEYVHVVVGYKTKNGTQEVVHQMDDGVTIDKFVYDLERKQEKVKEDGALIGFAPTGEEILKITVKYHKA